MWHIYRNSTGKFEFAFIKKGRYIAGTKQGYSSRVKATKSLYSLAGKVRAQDDTREISVTGILNLFGYLNLDGQKPSKKYVSKK